jgi:hypothetical protein
MTDEEQRVFLKDAEPIDYASRSILELVLKTLARVFKVDFATKDTRHTEGPKREKSKALAAA